MTTLALKIRQLLRRRFFRAFPSGDATTSAVDDVDPASPDPKSWASIDVTHTAGVVGTPAYMAPEQIAGAAFDGRADQFAFCVAAYEALFGVAPFPRDSLSSMVGAMVKGAIATPVSASNFEQNDSESAVRCDTSAYT